MDGPAELTREQLYDLIWSRPLSVVARELGISGNGLSKICDRLLIPYPPRGYWARAHAGRAPDAPSLPPAPSASDDLIVISGGRTPSRRQRTRFSAEARREQLVQAAADLIAKDGLSAASMKSVARQVGISEAQAHNHFPRRRDLLLALARRELHAMESHRRAELSRGHDRYTRVTLSTVTYLREVAERGALIQMLLSSGEVREGLRAERQVVRGWDTNRVSQDLTSHYGIPADLARAHTIVLTSLSLRAGRLLAAKKLSLDAAERLTIALITAGNREIVRAYQPARGAEA